jgi:serine/threonine protein phosphatase PrpC
MSVGHKAMALSKDHKPNRDDERDRIEDAGGQVVWAGTWRVGGVLAVSRSFGNRMMKEVRGVGRSGGHGNALDGLWKCACAGTCSRLLAAGLGGAAALVLGWLACVLPLLLRCLGAGAL